MIKIKKKIYPLQHFKALLTSSKIKQILVVKLFSFIPDFRKLFRIDSDFQLWYCDSEVPDFRCHSDSEFEIPDFRDSPWTAFK